MLLSTIWGAALFLGFGMPVHLLFPSVPPNLGLKMSHLASGASTQQLFLQEGQGLGGKDGAMMVGAPALRLQLTYQGVTKGPGLSLQPQSSFLTPAGGTMVCCHRTRQSAAQDAWPPAWELAASPVLTPPRPVLSERFLKLWPGARSSARSVTPDAGCEEPVIGPSHQWPLTQAPVVSSWDMCAHRTALSTDRTASGIFSNDLSHQ